MIVLDHLALSPEDFEAGEVVPVLCSVRSHALQTPGRFQLVATPPPPPRGPLFGFGWELNAHYRIDLCPDLNTLSAEKAMTHITTPSHYPYLEPDAYGPLSRRNSGFDGLRRSWHFYTVTDWHVHPRQPTPRAACGNTHPYPLICLMKSEYDRIVEDESLRWFRTHTAYTPPQASERLTCEAHTPLQRQSGY